MNAVLRVLVLGLFISASTAIAQPDETAAVNRLVVAVAQKVDQAERASHGERARLLHEALQLVEQIIREHPSTDIAVRFATRQPVGALDVVDIRRRHDEAVAVDCVERPELGCATPLAALVRAMRERSKEQETRLHAEQRIHGQARGTIQALLSQVEDLKQELEKLNAALEASEVKAREQNVQIIELGNRLNRALASRVQELQRYRSEFFGRLRELLADRPDIEIVGDRFVFPSEVLFPVGSPDLEESGKQRLARLARSLKEVAATIPREIPWILRVDGHTDRTIVRSQFFKSNWELSAARALTVVRFLTEQGVPPDRLAATSFGEFQPVDRANNEAAYAKNRRIEIKLTER